MLNLEQLEAEQAHAATVPRPVTLTLAQWHVITWCLQYAASHQPVAQQPALSALLDELLRQAPMSGQLAALTLQGWPWNHPA